MGLLMGKTTFLLSTVLFRSAAWTDFEGVERVTCVDGAPRRPLRAGGAFWGSVS